MKSAVGGVNKKQLSCYLNTEGYHRYIHDQEGRLCFLFNYFIYLDHRQFMEIIH